MTAPKRRWLQYSLRTLLLLMLLASLGMSYVAVRIDRKAKDRGAVERVGKLGGWVQYDDEVYARGDEVIVEEEEGVAPRKPKAPPGPAWLRRLLGDDFFTTPTVVNLSRSTVSDADLVSIGQLRQLLELNLKNTQVTDSGLEHLHGLTQLRSLNLKRTRVTDQGVQKLQLALPTCRIRK